MCWGWGVKKKKGNGGEKPGRMTQRTKREKRVMGGMEIGGRSTLPLNLKRKEMGRSRT